MKNFQTLKALIMIICLAASTGVADSEIVNIERELNFYDIQLTELTRRQAYIDSSAQRSFSDPPFTEETSWGFSDINVSFNDACEVEINTVITLPNVLGLDKADQDIRQIVRMFVRKIQDYENWFVESATLQASELVRHDCPENSDEINSFWEQTRSLWRFKTGSGESIGIHLRNFGIE